MSEENKKESYTLTEQKADVQKINNKMRGEEDLKKKVRKIVLLVLAVLIAGETIGLCMLASFNNAKKDKLKEQQALIDEMNSETFVSEKIDAEVGIKVLKEQMNTIGELSTTEYLYTDAAHFTDSKQINGFNVPLTKKSVLARWSGVIKAGIDIDQMTIDVDDDKRIITVAIPEARIMSNNVDDDSFETLDESDGLFNRVTVDDTVAIIGDTKKDMEKRATSAGILDKASANAKELIVQILESDKMIKDNYQIEFQTISVTEDLSDTES